MSPNDACRTGNFTDHSRSIKVHQVGRTSEQYNVELCWTQSVVTDTTVCQLKIYNGVILYIKESIQAYEIKLEKVAECEEAVWCNIVTGNSTLTVGLVYRSPNISMEEHEKIHNAIKEVSKRDCIIMGDFNHGHIQWTSLQSTGREDQEF